MAVNATLDITAAHRATLLALLNQHLPGVDIWAFGSRTQGTARPTSDLDLVAFVPAAQYPSLYDAREALEESSLPFRIDLLAWDELPDSFHQNILQHYIPLQYT